jgi:hypothetical protein
MKQQQDGAGPSTSDFRDSRHDGAIRAKLGQAVREQHDLMDHCPRLSSNCSVGSKQVLVFVKPPGRGCTRRSMNVLRRWCARPIGRANLANGKR